MAVPDFPDPDFPNLNFPFLTQALHRHCVDTNGRDDFDCDADWKASYFERNQPYFHTTKRDAVSIFSERTMKSVALKSSLKPRQNSDRVSAERPCQIDATRPVSRKTGIYGEIVAAVKFLDFLNRC